MSHQAESPQPARRPGAHAAEPAAETVPAGAAPAAAVPLDAAPAEPDQHASWAGNKYMTDDRPIAADVIGPGCRKRDPIRSSWPPT